MYEQHFGLSERPFDLSPSPRFLFLSRRHREALAHLKYGLGGRPGITLLVGEAGTGKTTLVRAALAGLGQSATSIVHLANPTLTRDEFYEYIAAGFGFGDEAGLSKTKFLKKLEETLRSGNPRVLALVVDEAQSLTHELLEELRLLTNTYSGSDRTLTLIMVGQPELAERLRQAPLRQFRQRISLRCELRPFELKETAAYITCRVRIAGGRAEGLFTRDAIVAVHERSGGIPRNISVICDNALVTGFAADVKPVGRDIVLEVCQDFDFEPVSPVAPTTAAPANGLTAASASARPADAGAKSNDLPKVNGAPVALTNAAPAGRPSPVVAEARPMFSGFTRPRRFSFF